MLKKKRETQSEGVRGMSETKVTKSMLCGHKWESEVWRKESEREEGERMMDRKNEKEKRKMIKGAGR